MSKTKSTSRCRKWQLTINNPMEHEMEHKAIKEILNTFPSLVYWCMGDEIGMETNTYHTHLFLSAKHPIRFTTLKNKFPMAHIECATGSSQENKNYILKCGKWEDTSKVETRVDGTFEEWGEIPNDTPLRFGDNQKHFGTLYRLIEEGLSDGEIIAYNPNYIPMISKFQLIRNAINEKSFSYERRDNLEIHYIYGPYRWDKVKRIRDKFGDMDIYSISNYENPFEDYACQDVIIFEEFDGSMPFDKLLHYLQKYPFKVGNTYHRNVACYTKIYIISTLPLQYQYRNEQKDEDYFSRMFLDRINTITYCKGEEEEIEHGLDIHYIEDDDFLPFQDEDTPTPLD